MKKIRISTKKIRKAVAQSSKLEGLSFSRAKKNKKMIKKLEAYGRSFAVLRDR